MKKVLVFSSTKKLADRIFDAIEQDFPAQLGVIHSNKAQNNRFNTVKQFDAGSYRILIATDIMARGLDITDISHVINFDINFSSLGSVSFTRYCSIIIRAYATSAVERMFVRDFAAGYP